jgi:hypothetical protein
MLTTLAGVARLYLWPHTTPPPLPQLQIIRRPSLPPKSQQLRVVKERIPIIPMPRPLREHGDYALKSNARQRAKSSRSVVRTVDGCKFISRHLTSMSRLELEAMTPTTMKQSHRAQQIRKHRTVSYQQLGLVARATQSSMHASLLAKLLMPLRRHGRTQRWWRAPIPRSTN